MKLGSAAVVAIVLYVLSLQAVHHANVLTSSDVQPLQMVVVGILVLYVMISLVRKSRRSSNRFEEVKS